MTIGQITLIVLIFGWLSHLPFLMRHIEAKRQKPTSLLWFIRNRPWKFMTMIVTPIPLAYVAYVALAPDLLSFDNPDHRLKLGIYFAVILVTGAGSNEIIDRLGVKGNVHRVDDDGDDFKTRIGKLDCEDETRL